MVILVVIIKFIIYQSYKQIGTFLWDWITESVIFPFFKGGAPRWSNVNWITIFITINNYPGYKYCTF